MSSLLPPSKQENGSPDKHAEFNGDSSRKSIRVWDLPTRIFHWSLVILTGFCLVSGHIGGNAMISHLRCGKVILFLLGFRLIWGVLGSAPSRFSTFIKGPEKVWAYIKTLPEKRSRSNLGHNPLGGWSVAAMLITLLIQTLTGLFSNDDIFLEGPLTPWISKSMSDWLTLAHKANQKILIVLAVTHIAAICFYWIYKRENLVWPMITGRKVLNTSTQQPAMKSTGMAIFIAGLTGVATYLLVR